MTPVAPDPDERRPADDESEPEASRAERPADMPAWMRMSTGELDRANYATLGLGFAAAVGLLTYAGLWLDERLGTKPLFVLLGLAAGLVGGTVSLIRRAGGGGRPRA